MYCDAVEKDTVRFMEADRVEALVTQIKLRVTLYRTVYRAFRVRDAALCCASARAFPVVTLLHEL